MQDPWVTLLVALLLRLSDAMEQLQRASCHQHLYAPFSAVMAALLNCTDILQVVVRVRPQVLGIELQPGELRGVQGCWRLWCKVQHLSSSTTWLQGACSELKASACLKCCNASQAADANTPPHTIEVNYQAQYCQMPCSDSNLTANKTATPVRSTTAAARDANQQ
jgi:hypothetical protein